MHKRVVGVACAAALAAWMGRPVAVWAQTEIPCDPIVQEECMTNYTCQTLEGITFCGGQPVQDGTPCTQGTAGECSSGPFTCQNGVCTATPVMDGTPCTNECVQNPTCLHGVCFGIIPANEGGVCSSSKCFEGHCTFGICIPGTTSKCTQPSDPCKQAICNPTDGSCSELETDKCNTFFGCETCNAGTCQPVRIGQPCTDERGDLNSCTTNDVCVNQQGRGVCMGVPISGMVPTSTPTNTPATTSTPTVTPSMTPSLSKPCAGDCNGDGEVSVDEEITMSGIVLGDEPASACPADHTLAIDDVVAGAYNSLNGCPL